MPPRASIRDAERLVRMVLDSFRGGRSRRRSPGQPSDPRGVLAGLAVLFLIVLAAAWLVSTGRSRPKLIPGAPAPRSAEGVLFCSWNVENFFDDRDDPTNRDQDEDWFAHDPEAFARKVGALRDAALLHNEGRGPDVLAMVEVESRRSVEALRDALNAVLPPDWRYTGIVQRDDRTGRRFAPAVLTRLAVREDLTRGPPDFGNRRILEAHLESDGVPLIVLASHWKSRLGGKDETEARREDYADAVYGRYLSLRRREPGLDVILAGDFNDEPGDSSLTEHLHAVSDPGLVRESDSEPSLLDLVADPSLAGQGTYFFTGRWEFLDHILAPPELLDAQGWTIRPETLKVGDFRELRRGPKGSPWKFGGPKATTPRGYSDHFALSVRLVEATRP
jgi:endonuclease/exonuclease/phosphatase family metal-dependent hydrolase